MVANKTQEITDPQEIGFTACYIHDYAFRHVADIPMEAAVAWVKSACQEINMGNGKTAEQLTIGTSTDTDADKNGWLNKLFIVVSNDHGIPVAIYNHDGQFSIYTGRAQ